MIRKIISTSDGTKAVQSGVWHRYKLEILSGQRGHTEKMFASLTKKKYEINGGNHYCTVH